MINLNEMKRDYIGREPRDYIVESVTVPEGLEEKVLAAMTQKRKEIEEIQKEKQEKKAAHKSVALRAAVIAAVITLMILMIPSSRQVVVSAAEKIWEYFARYTGSYTYDLNTTDIHLDKLNKDYSANHVDLGNVNSTVKIGCLELELSDLYIQNNENPNIPGLANIYLDATISHDETINYMPDFESFIQLVGLKNGEVVFSCRFSDEMGYYFDVINQGIRGYYNENGERIPTPYIYDENDEKIFNDDTTKYPWNQKKLKTTYYAEFGYFNFDKFGDEKNAKKYEKYKDDYFSAVGDDDYKIYIMNRIKKIKPDTYKIYEIKSYISTFDDPSKAPGCENYVTKYHYKCKDYDKYSKYSLFGQYDGEF